MPSPKRTTTTSPAFQFYPSDFLGSPKVQSMSLTETGAYIRLLAMCWEMNGLPADPARLAKMLRIPLHRFTRIWAGVVSECFVQRGDRFFNPRLDREKQKQKSRSQRASDNANSRWNKDRHDADAMQTQCDPASKSHASSIALLSPSPVSYSGSTQRQGASLTDRSHRSHAHCGVMCVPADLHNKFVRSRRHDGADKELRDWYLTVDREWSEGAKKGENTGANDYTFWRARYEERWPAPGGAAQTAAKPKWGTWRPAEAR